MVIGAIGRPIGEDELQILFDTREPVPLPAVASFLLAVHEATRGELGDGYFLELVDFGKGSEEFRFRAIRELIRSQNVHPDGDDSWQRIDKIKTAVRVLRSELGYGQLAVRARDILLGSSGSHLITQGGFEAKPVIYDAATLAEAAEFHESGKETKSQPLLEAQLYLKKVVDEGEGLELVGKVMPRKPKFFRTAKGTKLPIAARPSELKNGELVAISAEVVAMPDEDSLGIVIGDYQYKDDR